MNVRGDFLGSSHRSNTLNSGIKFIKTFVILPVNRLRDINM